MCLCLSALACFVFLERIAVSRYICVYVCGFNLLDVEKESGFEMCMCVYVWVHWHASPFAGDVLRYICVYVRGFSLLDD